MSTMPVVGDRAPEFDLHAYPSGQVKLSDFRGKQNVILAFYPKDDTPGCTREMCAFSTDLSKFVAADTVVLGISADDTTSHEAFAKKFSLTQTLLADPERKACQAYGATQGKDGYAERVLFVIDKEGMIRHVHKGMPDNATLLTLIEGLK